MPANETRFRCDECGKLTAGRIGREGGLRGDRSGRYPRRHNGPGGKVCPGVFMEAVWVDVPRKTEGELKNRQGNGYIVETPKVGGIQTIRIGDRNVAKKAAKGVQLSTGAGAMAKATKAPKPKKGGASIITPESGADREVAPVGKREQLKTDIANAVAKLSEQVERAEKDLNDAKEVLKEKRSGFNELARKLREESKLLADMVAGRPVPRNLFN